LFLNFYELYLQNIGCASAILREQALCDRSRLSLYVQNIAVPQQFDQGKPPAIDLPLAIFCSEFESNKESVHVKSTKKFETNTSNVQKMIFITDQMYAEMANMLFAEMQNGQHYYNGKLEYDTEQFYSTLTCSLIVYRTETVSTRKELPQIERVVPVWWEYSICADGVTEPNDFSWSEFSTFFPCHG